MPSHSRTPAHGVCLLLLGSPCTKPTHSVIREPDENAAPFVFLYILGVVGCLAAVLAWVFWFRGYA